MIEVKICEKCGLVHPKYYDGLKCRNKWCDGKLVLTQFPEREKLKPECQFLGREQREKLKPECQFLGREQKNGK